jgi:hypothetical protein
MIIMVSVSLYIVPGWQDRPLLFEGLDSEVKLNELLESIIGAPIPVE